MSYALMRPYFVAFPSFLVFDPFLFSLSDWLFQGGTMRVPTCVPAGFD